MEWSILLEYVLKIVTLLFGLVQIYFLPLVLLFLFHSVFKELFEIVYKSLTITRAEIIDGRRNIGFYNWISNNIKENPVGFVLAVIVFLILVLPDGIRLIYECFNGKNTNSDAVNYYVMLKNTAIVVIMFLLAVSHMFVSKFEDYIKNEAKVKVLEESVSTLQKELAELRDKINETSS